MLRDGCGEAGRVRAILVGEIAPGRTHFSGLLLLALLFFERVECSHRTRIPTVWHTHGGARAATDNSDVLTAPLHVVEHVRKLGSCLPGADLLHTLKVHRFNCVHKLV